MIAEFETAVTCPDCDSETKLIELAPHVFTAAVMHDETCPWINSQGAT